MKNKKCVYIVEGSCERKLIRALRENPALIAPGKTQVFNVIQDILPSNLLMQFGLGSIIALVFDTDIDKTDILIKNIGLLNSLNFRVDVVTIAQVLNFENEIERATDVKHAPELTKSKGVSDFKSAVNRMKEVEFRQVLERHKFDINKLWISRPPKAFSFITQGAEIIKEISK